MTTDPSRVDLPTEAVVLVSCPDRPGIVARLNATLDEVGGNILDASQYTDVEGETFLQRVHVSWPSLNPEPEEVHAALQELADQFRMDWRIHWGHAPRKVAVFVSREDHCLHDLLLLQRDGSLQCQISLIISNHPDLEQVADRFDIPFHHVEVAKSGDSDSESRQLSLLEAHDIDLVARPRHACA